MGANFTDVAVIMVPLPEYGHLIPLLRLSRLISSYNIPVHYATFGARNHVLKLRVQDWKLDQFPYLHFHDLPENTCNLDEELEEDEALYLSLRLLGEPLRALCHEISTTCRKLVIIHDTFMLECMQGMYHELKSSINNVEIYIFHGCLALTVYSWIQQVTRNKDDHHDNDLFLPLESNVPSIESWFSPGMADFINLLLDWRKFTSAGEIFNTCRDIEGPYLDALAKQSEKPVWGLGPLNPVHAVHGQSSSSHRCIEWLDQQPDHSVIFVSFGTTITFSPEQINELAIGLEGSEHRFIWVVRSKDKRGDATEDQDTPNIDLPTGFEERVAERGVIARDWTPQLEILAHRATGGYLFHSGGGSFLESISNGVPMATWPMHSDHPFNDVLITKVLKVGVVVRDWTRKDELVRSNTIEKALKILMDSPQGEEMRQRATELSQAIKMCFDDGKQMATFNAHITRKFN